MKNPVFGTIVRKAREKMGLTQADLAYITGYTQASVCRIESGRQLPPLEGVFILCDLLHIKIMGIHDELHIDISIYKARLHKVMRNKKPAVS